MRIIAAIGRYGFDLEMVRQPKGKAPQIGGPESGMEMREVESAVSHPIIGFVRDDEDD